MTRRWLAAGGALAALLMLAQPQRAAADMHWLAYYPGATINWYEGPYPYFWSWQNVHWPARDSFMTYGVSRPGTYKVYYPSPEASGRYYYLTPKAGVVREDTSATIEVKLPSSDADLWFNTVRTSRTGIVRQFRTPPLVEGRDYVYDVLALWGTQDQEKQLRKVQVSAGASVVVDFTAPYVPPK
jgi:uncharacterized protein (TIGR03000 family)